ncbi:MAG: hypothetical protein ACYTGV_16590 [Planctomycetota bacterium]|jgi:hypothetical protein
MDTKTPITFTKRSAADGVDLDGYGCPECGSPEFSQVWHGIEYYSETGYGTWSKDGEAHADDWQDREWNDSETTEVESTLTCNDCHHEYDQSEGELSQHYVGDVDDGYGTCLQQCEDEDCAGDCRTDADWPFLGDHGVARYDALGAQLEKLAPHAGSFTWDERIGFTMVTAMPKTSPRSRDSWREGTGEKPCCTACGGDMTTPYMRTTHLPYKQERHPYSTVEGPLGTTVVTMQFQQAIC